MLIEDVVNYFGNGSMQATCRVLKLNKSSAHAWGRIGDGVHVPVKIALLAEELSGGKLKFDKAPYQADLLEKFNSK